MNRLNIYKPSHKEQTMLSNYFIDEFMADANDAQLKIYLFLIRMMSANLPTSVCDIADKFNYTEKDVLRALMYWESRQLLSLEYDAAHNLTGIQVLSLDNPYEIQKPATRITPVLSFVRPASMQTGMTAPAARPVAQTAFTTPVTTASISQYPIQQVANTPVKPEYSLDDLKVFKSNEDAQQILFVAEQYLGRQLTRKDMETVLFIYDTLGFTSDLIDYLIQHCVEKGKKDFRYIEKVALAWADQGITTPKEAQEISKQYDKTVYTIMKSLGKNSLPAPKEMEYINKWTKEYGFLLDVIQEACDKTVLTTDNHRFAYADGILTKWYQAGVHHKSDIPQADASYQRMNQNQKMQNNKFNRFEQNTYDYDELEAAILSN
ncbi:MAG: DnaD domain protein [Lachnospiraceae bacterium]|nr:DnaD domain protein [Lachnospiraceae bacterium]